MYLQLFKSQFLGLNFLIHLFIQHILLCLAFLWSWQKDIRDRNITPALKQPKVKKETDD